MQAWGRYILSFQTPGRWAFTIDSIVISILANGSLFTALVSPGITSQVCAPKESIASKLCWFSRVHLNYRAQFVNVMSTRPNFCKALHFTSNLILITTLKSWQSKSLLLPQQNYLKVIFFFLLYAFLRSKRTKGRVLA